MKTLFTDFVVLFGGYGVGDALLSEPDSMMHSMEPDTMIHSVKGAMNATGNQNQFPTSVEEQVASSMSESQKEDPAALDCFTKTAAAKGNTYCSGKSTYDTAGISDPAACAQKCVDTPDCKSFIWYYNPLSPNPPKSQKKCGISTTCTAFTHKYTTNGGIDGYMKKAVCPAKAIQASMSPQKGSCPSGYLLQAGILAGYPTCPDTAIPGWCILPKDKAKSFCDDKIDCDGVSETINKAWFTQGKVTLGMVQAGKSPIAANLEWATCVKVPKKAPEWSGLKGKANKDVKGVEGNTTYADDLHKFGLCKVSDWTDHEKVCKSEVPEHIFADGACRKKKSKNVGIWVTYADGLDGYATYPGVQDKWCTKNFNGINPNHVGGMMENCNGLHFLTDHSCKGLPLAWDGCKTKYSNNFDIDFDAQGCSDFRASKKGWKKMRVRLYCDCDVVGLAR